VIPVDIDGSPLWKTKDGRKLKISEMSAAHLSNTIKFIKRNMGWRDEYLPVLEAEAEKRKLGLARIVLSVQQDYLINDRYRPAALDTRSDS
jgi:hypothetical protein